MKKLTKIAVVLLLISCQSSLQTTEVESLPTFTSDPHKDWMVLKSPELGIEFKFPPMPGEIWYEYMEWPGGDYGPASSFVNWQIVREDLHLTYSFAGCTSGYVYQGRESWITDLASWYHANEKDYLVRTHNKVIEVSALKRIVRNDGLQGLIFDPPENLAGGDSDAIAAILNFPETYNSKIRCLSFLFIDPISWDDVESVLLSVSIPMK